MTNEDRFFELLAKRKLNNSTLNDIAELNRLANEYNIDLNSYANFDCIYDLKFASKDLPNYEQTEKSWDKFKRKLEPGGLDSLKILTNTKVSRNTKKIFITISSIAAGILIFLSFYWVNFKRNGNDLNKLNIISTQYGSKSKLQMPDGTVIWLNAGSEITYTNQYGKNTRTVNLIGEAYFDVVHDGLHPFIIHTKNLDLKVLGTAFNVRAFNNEKISEATLIRGSLEVSFPNRPSKKIILSPNEKLSLNNEIPTVTNYNTLDTKEKKQIISISTVDKLPNETIVEEIAWTENKLIFRSKAFKDLALDLERWYNIKIDIKNKNISDKRFTGVFKNENFEEALNALKATYSFDYHFNKINNTVTIIEK